MTNSLLLVPCQLPYAFFIIHTLIKQVSRIKSTSASSSLLIHHSRLILTPCRCFQPCTRTPPRYLFAPCMTLCYMHPAPTLWSTTRKGRGARPNHTRPGYFHCSSRPPQPARRPFFITHYRPRRPGSGSHFDDERYPMTWTPGPSVRKHASSRRAPRLVTAGPPAPPLPRWGGRAHTLRPSPRTQGLGRDALALSLVNRSGPATTKGGGGDTSRPLLLSHLRRLGAAPSDGSRSPFICSPAIGPSRGGERRWTLHCWQHLRHRLDYSSTPRHGPPTLLADPNGAGIPEQELPHRGLGRRSSRTPQPDTKKRVSWPPLTCSNRCTYGTHREIGNRNSAEDSALVYPPYDTHRLGHRSKTAELALRGSFATPRSAGETTRFDSSGQRDTPSLGTRWRPQPCQQAHAAATQWA